MSKEKSMGVNFNLYRKLIVLDPFTTIIIVIIIIIIIINLWVILFVCFSKQHAKLFER